MFAYPKKGRIKVNNKLCRKKNPRLNAIFPTHESNHMENMGLNEYCSIMCYILVIVRKFSFYRESYDFDGFFNENTVG